MCLAALLTATCCFAQSDPGPRGGTAGAGAAIGGLTPGELDFFNNHGVPQFSQVEAVADGLGPRFNLDSCGGVRHPPAPRGSTAPVKSPRRPAALRSPDTTLPALIAPSCAGPAKAVIEHAHRKPDRA